MPRAGEQESLWKLLPTDPEVTAQEGNYEKHMHGETFMEWSGGILPVSLYCMYGPVSG